MSTTVESKLVPFLFTLASAAFVALAPSTARAQSAPDRPTPAQVAERFITIPPGFDVAAALAPFTGAFRCELYGPLCDVFGPTEAQKVVVGAFEAIKGKSVGTSPAGAFVGLLIAAADRSFGARFPNGAPAGDPYWGSQTGNASGPVAYDEANGVRVRHETRVFPLLLWNVAWHWTTFYERSASDPSRYLRVPASRIGISGTTSVFDVLTDALTLDTRAVIYLRTNISLLQPQFRFGDLQSFTAVADGCGRALDPRAGRVLTACTRTF